MGQTVCYFLRYVFTMGLESYVLVTLAASFLQVRWLVYMVTTDQVALLMTSVSVSGASAAWDEHDLKLRNVGKTLSHCQALVQVCVPVQSKELGLTLKSHGPPTID